MSKLLSYKNDPDLKKKFVKEVLWHQQQDKILQGTYGDNTDDGWKGCAVACSLRSLDKINGVTDLEEEYSDHKRYESELGLPEWLAKLEDTLFEGLPRAEAEKWPVRFAKAIPVGADLESLKWKFSVYLMKENIDRVLALEISSELKEQVVSSIRGVLVLNEEAIKTGVWDESAAESAAWSAAESAASAAWSAESAAESAAASAASAAHVKHSKELLKLLKGAN